MINEKTLKWKYYLNKLPLYLQSSYGFKEHFKMLFQIMINTNSTVTDLLNALNLTDKNYYNNLNIKKSEKEDLKTSSSEYVYDLLDKIGLLYGVNRYLDVDYTDINGDYQHQSLKLNNEEFLKLILVKVVQNSYLGTYEDIRKLYNLIELPIYLYNSEETSGEVYCVFDNREINSNNLLYLFYADLLSIKSMGIKYNYRTIDQSNVGEWDADLDTKLWDVGEWS